jgi:hypothetical protein
MNTVQLRDRALEEQMLSFEEVYRDRPGYIVGFYSSIIRDLAVDKIADYNYVMEVLKGDSK